ncbi:MAG: urea ABC transporter permease subunit UrtB [Gammaproteobacteria bacterium]
MNLAKLTRGLGVFLLLSVWTVSIPAQETEPAQEPAVPPTFEDAVAAFNASSLAKLGTAIETLAQIEHPRTTLVLEALLDGKLYRIKSDGRMAVGEESSAGYRLSAADNGDDLGLAARDAVKNIRLSNSLRSKLRLLLAQAQLNSPDAATRLEAVKAMAKHPDAESLALLERRTASEQDPDVRAALALVFALRDMDSGDRALRLAALEELKRQTSFEAYNKLKAIVAKDADGRNVEPDDEVRRNARSALAKIESRLQSYQAAETVFFGLSLGAVLVLAAIGLAITFGVMGVINMAHGELMMLGAYTTYVMQQLMPDHLALSLLLSVPAAFVIAGLVGIGIERGIIRFLYGRPLETLLATFGVSLFLQQTVRSIFSPLNRSVSTPDFMSGSLQINDFLSFTWNRFYILIFCLLVFALLLQILRRTRLGLEVRAVAQNRNMAKAMGIPTDRVDAMTFGLGSGIAGVAGVALSQITNVGPNLGQSYIVDSFMVVVFGGVGNLWGTLVAGFSLGIANKVLEPYAGAVLAKILVLVFIILFIQKRPRGLFPQKGRAAEA